MRKTVKDNIIIICAVLGTLIASFICALFICEYITCKSEVTGTSMENTLHEGDIVRIWKICSVKRGDIVVFFNPLGGDELLVKRCIAIPGDTIEMSKNGVYINGVRIYEPYLKDNYTGDGYLLNTPTTLNDDEYIFLGDNRAASYDSRMLGPVNKSYIYGVVK